MTRWPHACSVHFQKPMVRVGGGGGGGGGSVNINPPNVYFTRKQHERVQCVYMLALKVIIQYVFSCVQ